MNRAVIIVVLTTSLGLVAGALMLSWLMSAYSSPLVWALGVISAIVIVIGSFVIGVLMGAAYVKRRVTSFINQ